MDACTPPPSPTPRLTYQQRDRTRSRRTASPRLKIRRRSFSERPSTPTQRPPSPELIFSMSPIDSHFPPAPPAPKTQLNPGALLARARQQSANAFAALANHQRPRTPLLYSFPRSDTHLRASPTTGTTRAESRPARFRFSPIAESSDDAAQSPEAVGSIPARSMPIAISLPIPIPASHSHDFINSVQYSPGSSGSLDADTDNAFTHPPKIVGFDTGIESEMDSGGSSGASPLRLEHLASGKAFCSDARGNTRGIVRPLQTRNRD